MMFTAKIKGEIAICSIDFYTAGINGHDGSLRMPAATAGSYIKKEKVLQRIVKYVRENLPLRHALRAKARAGGCPTCLRPCCDDSPSSQSTSSCSGARARFPQWRRSAFHGRAYST